uniref:bcl-2-like protein 2 isoform X2 n=1 Tax=Myxine glutinosa TaxID=7769 RepID=UPI00358E6928
MSAGPSARDMVREFIAFRLAQAGYSWPRPASPDSDEPEPLVRSGRRSSQPGTAQRCVRVAAAEFERRYRRAFSALPPQLGPASPAALRGRLVHVLSELFAEGVNWGRVVAFFVFGAALCAESAEKAAPAHVDSLASCMCDYLENELQPWIDANGGWAERGMQNNERNFLRSNNTVRGWDARDDEEAFVELYGSGMAHEQPAQDNMWPSLQAVLGLAAVGACLTVGALMAHK